MCVYVICIKHCGVGYRIYLEHMGKRSLLLISMITVKVTRGLLGTWLD